MKKSIIYTSLAALLFATTSCKDDFLETSPTETVSTPPTQFKLNGIYTLMATTYSGGTTGHNDFGVKGYDIYSDLLSSDMALEGVNYGWYRDLANLTATTDFTTNTTYTPWRFFYKMVNAANDVIQGLGGNDATPSIDADKYGMGQAKALRAYAYFYLMQLYTTKYDPASPSIPLYTDPTQAGAPLAKQSEVYAQMVKDLKEASTLLQGFQRGNKGMVNQQVAESLLAYVYGAMDMPAEAEVYAKKIVDNTANKVTTAAEAIGGFNKLDTPSWLWGFDVTLENGLDLVSWWGQVDVFTYSYAWAGDPKGIDLGLWDQIRDGDIRKTQFTTLAYVAYLNANGGFLKDDDGEVIVEEIDNLPPNVEENDVVPVADLYHVDAANVNYAAVYVVELDYESVPAYKFYDTGRRTGGQRVVTTDYIYMRTDEMYFLYAESLAKQGKDVEARGVLKEYLEANRMDDASYLDNLSGAALQNEIYLQQRIEFWGEGRSYWAMKRNKATIKRGPNHIYFVGQPINYSDPRLSFKIPQAEVDNNPNIN